MGIFRRKMPSHFIPIDRNNAAHKDWLILLEAGTIVGPSPERLRVARATQERKLVRKYNLTLRVQYFLVVEGFNPRIHVVYLCPQLYRHESDKRLVPLQGDEIGRLIAQAVEGGVSTRRPWYEPTEKLPDEPVINVSPLTEFDTVVVEMPNGRNSAATGT